MVKNITYAEYRKRSDVHGTVLYPAVMAAPVQKDILDDLIDKDVITTVFEPFHGSGTALYECQEVSNNVRLCGCDINPLANLITRTKLLGVTSSIKKDLAKLQSLIKHHTIVKPYHFENIDKWFRSDIQHDLQTMRECIAQIDSKRNRDYFWCMFSDIVRRYSNTRSSTYKLHLKPRDAIVSMENHAIVDFFTSIEHNIEKYIRTTSNSFKLYKCDVIGLMHSFRSRRFDISITSPPYGDNATTVPYGQFSILQLLWIDHRDLELEGWEFDNFSIIDSNSIGGKAKEIQFNSHGLRLLLPYLEKISKDKQRKVIRFFNDYFTFLDQLTRVTKRNIVLTLGNRTVDRVTIDLTQISIEYLAHKGFQIKQLLERDIPVKRIPKTTSIVGDSPVESINSEFVIISERSI